MNPSITTQPACRRWECRQSLTLALAISLLLSAVSVASLNGPDVYEPVSTLDFESQLWEYQQKREQKIEADIQSMPDQGAPVPLPPEAALLLDQNQRKADSNLETPGSNQATADLPIKLIDESYRLVAANIAPVTDAAANCVVDSGGEITWEDSAALTAGRASSPVRQAEFANKGPTAITLLVGFAAAVVVIGALFSGRE